jgi:hypothetical protein
VFGFLKIDGESAHCYNINEGNNSKESIM